MQYFAFLNNYCVFLLSVLTMGTHYLISNDADTVPTSAQHRRYMTLTQVGTIMYTIVLTIVI